MEIIFLHPDEVRIDRDSEFAVLTNKDGLVMGTFPAARTGLPRHACALWCR